MEKIKIMEKSFPFVLFNFILLPNDRDIDIYINNMRKYYFYYFNNKWAIYNFISYMTFDNFLERFIQGLIHWNLY